MVGDLLAADTEINITRFIQFEVTAEAECIDLGEVAGVTKHAAGYPHVGRLYGITRVHIQSRQILGEVSRRLGADKGRSGKVETRTPRAVGATLGIRVVRIKFQCQAVVDLPLKIHANAVPTVGLFTTTGGHREIRRCFKGL